MIANGIYRSKGLQFLVIDLPIFLLIFNFILYAAFGIDGQKTPMRIGAFILFICGWIINGEYRVTYLQLFTIFLLFVMILLQGTEALNFLAVFIFAFATKIDLKRLVKKVFNINLLLIVFMLLCIYAGVAVNSTYTDSVGRVRSTMGFINPNAGSMFYCSAIYLYILSRDKIRIRDYIIALAGNFLIFSFSNSRTPFVAVCLFLLMIPIFNRVISKPVIKLGVCALNDFIWVLGVISLFILDMFSGFNDILSNRINLFMELVNQFGIWGAIIGGTDFQDITIDNFYLTFLYQNGIFPYLLAMYLVHTSTRNLVIRKETRLLAFISSLFLMGVMESSFIRPEIPITLILWKILFMPYSLRDSNKLKGRVSEENAIM